MSMRSWLILSIVVVGGGGTLAVRHFNGSDGAYEITTARVESGPITMTIETLGTIQPMSTVEVGCEVTGRIIEILADHDEPVEKGQVICRIDPEIEKANHSQSQADYQKAKSVLEDAKLAREEQVANLPVLTQQALAKKQEAEAAILDAEFNWNRVKKLHAAGDASDAEMNGVKAAYDRARAGRTGADAAYRLAKNNELFVPQRAAAAVGQAVAALDLAEARRDLTAARVERCTIRSPIDGIVLRRFFDVGTTVTAAFQTPVLFLLAPNLDRLKVNGKVSESDIVHIDIGQPARFTVEGKRQARFEGKILQKRNQPEIVQNVVTYTVVMEVENDAERTLLPGMSVNVEIECLHRPEAVTIANAVLRFKPPLSLNERRAMKDALTRPPAPVDENGNEVIYCKKAEAWLFDRSTEAWRVVPLWVGITDNVASEVLVGAKPGDDFVTKFFDKSKSGFNFKEALKLASPNNRSI